MLSREEQIEQRMRELPEKNRGAYKRAMAGKSRKAAMESFCILCCGGEINEVFVCTDESCPLHPYRPQSRLSTGGSEGQPLAETSKKSALEVVKQGQGFFRGLE